MRSLIAGGTGKVGSAVAERLRGEGWPVVAAGRAGGDLSSAENPQSLDAIRAALG